jgi:two-component system chemotaxis sensor kinase CheA
MTHLVHFTHALENLLDRLRSAEMQATDEVISVLLQSVDSLRQLLEAEPDAELPPQAVALEKRIAALTPAEKTEEAYEMEAASAPDEGELHLYTVDFHPDREIFHSGTNPILLLRELASLGVVSCCHLDTEDLPPLAELDPSQCYLKWKVELASSRPEAELREVFEFVEHMAEVHVHRVEAKSTRSTPLAKITENVKAPQPAPQEPIDAPPLPPVKSVTLASASPSVSRAAAKKVTSGADSSSIRVATEKIDRLIDLVGELVIANVMTAQMVKDFEPTSLPRLREAVAAMERSTRELHERVMSVRMLPVGTLFNRYTRTVYDIAQATGKQIRLEIKGEETEVDKSMLDLLGDPLTHLVRNAADHGIETPEVRLAAGKPAEGLITLKAYHRSGRIVIEGSDDGAGINLEKVRRISIERGLIAADAQLSDEQLMMLIFEPGFSTKEAVSNLSGRGVGMDVVKRNVEQMHGTVSLSSEFGRGSMVTIELPLTLAILEGLLVRVVDRTLVLPLLSVVETVPLRPIDIVRVAEQGEVVVIRGESVPLLRMARFLGLPQESAEAAEAGAIHRRLAVIVMSGAKKIGLVVDELLGQQQVVGKSLKRNLRAIDGLMGATILGDGCVAPIVDVGTIGTLNLYSLQAPAKAVPQGTASAQPVAAA